MKPIQFKKIYDYYTPINLKQKYKGKYASLVSLLSNEIGSLNLEVWLEFIDGRGWYDTQGKDRTMETEDFVEVKVKDDNNVIQISFNGHFGNNENFITTKEDFKRIIVEWINLIEKEVNGIIMSKKKGKIVFAGCEKVTRKLRKIRLGRRKRYRNINIHLKKVVLQLENFQPEYEENTQPEQASKPILAGYRIIMEDNISLHPLHTLVRFLDCEIENLAKNWIKWLKDNNETYKLGEFIELKKINTHYILLSDIQKDYAASIDDDPYAFYTTIDELITLIKEWKKIRAKEPIKITFSYNRGKASVLYPLYIDILQFPDNFEQIEFIKENEWNSLYRELFFPGDWSDEKLIAIANTARQYFDDNEIYAYITNGCKYHRVEGYTITGIKIRFIRKGPKILDYFPVVETTYENAIRDLLPYPENEDS